jgi:hypothetical protein
MPFRVHWLPHVNSIEAEMGEVSVPQFPSHFPLLPFSETQTSASENALRSNSATGK